PLHPGGRRSPCVAGPSALATQAYVASSCARHAPAVAAGLAESRNARASASSSYQYVAVIGTGARTIGTAHTTGSASRGGVPARTGLEAWQLAPARGASSVSAATGELGSTPNSRATGDGAGVALSAADGRPTRRARPATQIVAARRRRLELSGTRSPSAT